MDKYTDNYYSQDTEEAEINYERASVETELRKTIQRQKKTMFRLMEKINRLRIICVVLLCLLIIESFLWWGNSGSDNVPVTTPTGSSAQGGSAPAGSASGDKSGAVVLNETDEMKIDALINNMTLEQKIYQMIFTTPENLTGVNAVTVAGDSTREAIKKYPVGGIIYSSKNLESRQQVKDMLSKVQSFSEIGLFLAIAENGGESPISSADDVSAINIPSAKSIGSSGDTAQATEAYSTIAAEMVELGFNVNFAPYAEISSGDDYFSSDANSASGMVTASVEGMKKYNLSSALKYFPTNSDSSKSVADMKNSEFVPFKAGISAGADFVIVSGKSSSGGEAYLMSEAVVKEALKTELGFGGVVVADDITAEGISRRYTQEEAAVKAVKAGADMLICPIGVSRTVTAISEAVDSGEIKESAINESVKRILAVKILRGVEF